MRPAHLRSSSEGVVIWNQHCLGPIIIITIAIQDCFPEPLEQKHKNIMDALTNAFHQGKCKSQSQSKKVIWISRQITIVIWKWNSFKKRAWVLGTQNKVDKPQLTLVSVRKCSWPKSFLGAELLFNSLLLQLQRRQPRGRVVGSCGRRLREEAKAAD